MWLTAAREGIAVQPVSPVWIYGRDGERLGDIIAEEFVADRAGLSTMSSTSCSDSTAGR